MGFVNIILVTKLFGHPVGSPWLAIPIVLAIGAAVGAVNRTMIAYLRFPPVITTLGMFFVLSGVNLYLVPNPVTVDAAWTDRLADSFGPLPGALLTTGVPSVLWVVLQRTAFVESLLAVGDHDATAFSAGVNVSVIRAGAYVVDGIIAAIGGIALTALVRSADAQVFSNYVLLGLAAVALGGTNLAGGRGGLVGPLLGAASIFMLQTLLTALHGSACSSSSRHMRRAVHRCSTRVSSLQHPNDGVNGLAATLASSSKRRFRRLGMLPVLDSSPSPVSGAATVITIPGFLGRSSLFSMMLILASFLGIAALGQTIVVLLGGIDLSCPCTRHRSEPRECDVERASLAVRGSCRVCLCCRCVHWFRQRVGRVSLSSLPVDSDPGYRRNGDWPDPRLDAWWAGDGQVPRGCRSSAHPPVPCWASVSHLCSSSGAPSRSCAPLSST